MPRYSVEHGGKWAEFSSIVDDFITPFMNKDSYVRWCLAEYGKANYKAFEQRNVETIAEAVFSISINRTRAKAIQCLLSAGIDKAESEKLMYDCETVHYCPVCIDGEIRCPNCNNVVQHRQEICHIDDCEIRLVWRT